MQSRVKRNIFLSACMLAVLSAPAAYGENPSWHTGGASAPPASITKRTQLTSIKQILDHQKTFVGKDITVRGLFRGWKGKCPSSSLLTRSDWMLEDETGCIYITGRIPNALSPVQPKGERVLVQGRVITTKKGKPVIKAARITLLPK